MDKNDPLRQPLIPQADEMGQGDSALAIIGNRRVQLTEEENRKIRRKTDKVILAILVWVYFLQILDKTVLGYGAIFGLIEDTHLSGNQYSLIGSIGPIAQLAWQPFSMILIVKVPHRVLMPTLVLGWGLAQAAMGVCNNFGGLLATRFFLGLFEAGCLPLFSVITSQWYRRAEQPIRVAAWYGTNGVATIVASALSYGLGHIPTQTMRSWRIIFIFVGLVTIISAPFVYWKLDNDIPSARFLTEHEREQAIERLRANQTGTRATEFRWSHVFEALLELKTYLWIAMSLLLNIGAAVTNTFGPLILNGFGYDKYITSLLNMPFGAVQVIVIMLASYFAQKHRRKSAVLILLILPVITGLSMLYSLPPESSHSVLVLAYYLLACIFGGNPLIVTWIVGNTAGTTKQSIITSLYNAGSSTGNIIGPLLFVKEDSPRYRNGLRSVLISFIALAVVILAQVANLVVLNKLHRRSRAAEGKKANIKDVSMNEQYAEFDEENDGLEFAESQGSESQDERTGEMDTARIISRRRLGENAFQDLTDKQNNEFIYIY
ncbi:TPA_exp: putative MFS transporter [Trichophyton benhamiae CBS 112371]|uniref:MFS transporter, putative n=1 Tax=Arthroderma benhamiae (strain ATCC MYA-4681 / CBS 112371) TaxID=663331 RepID=D4ANF4_ARTBC|nr:MFS transporter, putative [Trichophyton benhamiae CBS 112371]EFE35715.1 MFS transporter, putative [Trichophyton benhamiae CBS 112371]DAA78542.1 TPA_exp: putative MFS transporter [Trichophyton benhamiae CBS 112371]